METKQKPNSEQAQFKAELFEKFQETGILHDLKAKMRHDLLTKLQTNKGKIIFPHKKHE